MKKIRKILMIGIGCIFFTGCNGSSVEKSDAVVENQYQEEQVIENEESVEEAGIEPAKETDVEIEGGMESDVEEAETIPLDGYEYTVYDSYGEQKNLEDYVDLLGFNLPEGYEAQFLLTGGNRLDIGVPVQFYTDLTDGSACKLEIEGEHGYFNYFECTDDKEKEYFDSYRKIIETTEMGGVETPFGMAKTYKIKRGFPRTEMDDSTREYLESTGTLYEENEVLYVTQVDQVAVLEIQGRHIEIACYEHQDLEELLHQMFDL